MPQKRAYSAPTLVAYGTLTALTGALDITFQKVGSNFDDVTPFLQLIRGNPRPV